MKLLAVTVIPVLLLLLSFSGVARISGQTGSQYADMERRILSLENKQRREQKLLNFDWKEAVAAQCRLHSRNMALGLVPAGHQGAEGRIRALPAEVKVLTWSENVAVSRGYADPALDAVTGWMKSEGHRKPILGDYNLTGVGIVMSSDSTFYITQIFIKSR